jgi:hypothetical protein
VTTILDQPVSLFAGAATTKVLETQPLGEVLERIRNGYYQDELAPVLAAKARGEEAYKRAKRELPAFTPACALTTRAEAVAMADKLVSLTGCLHYDFDKVTDLGALKASLAKHPATVYVFTSPSGEGLKANIAATGIVDAVTYRHGWQYVLARLKDAYPDVVISEDPLIKYASALCFVSHDPALYVNADAQPIIVPARGPDDENPPLDVTGEPENAPDFKTISSALAWIPCEDYAVWLEIGAALHATRKPWARAAWDAWSQQSPKFDAGEQARKWKECQKLTHIHAGHILTLAHREGWRPAGWAGVDEGNTSYLVNGKIEPADPHETSPKPNYLVSSFSSLPRHHAWPVLRDAALYGLAGDIVRAIEPESESDRVALLAQLLTEFGVVIGRHAYGQVEATAHYGNLFVVIAGRTARSRKGTSYGHIAAIMRSADATWGQEHHIKGAGSGEGLVYAVRDQRMGREPRKEKGIIVEYQEVELDPGVDDKRAIYVTGEFSSVLKVASREGNTLSETLRDIWDVGHLQCTTKHNPIHATDAHIGIIGHITIDEIRKMATSIDMANGFLNRFIWICAQRSKELPDGGNLSQVNFQALVQRLRQAIAWSQPARRLTRDAEATALWHHVYGKLSANRTGLADTILARAEAQVFRVSILYALLDCSAEIRLVHLQAALALWQYAEDSAAFIFGDTVGDETADPILQALTKAGDAGLTRDQILTGVLQGNVRAAELSRALSLLEEQGRITHTQKVTGNKGRPATVYHAVVRMLYEENEENALRYGSPSNGAAKSPDLSDGEITGEIRSNSPEQPCEEDCQGSHTPPYGGCGGGESAESPAAASDGGHDAGDCRVIVTEDGVVNAETGEILPQPAPEAPPRHVRGVL